MNARAISITVVAVLTAVILIFPWIGEIFGIRFPTSYEMRLMVRAMILCMVVIGLNILVGLAGLVSLGQAALYGLGAHVAALLALRLGFSFGEAMIGAVILPAIVGAFLAFPTLRVRKCC
jgi:branched-chain amino acid transport system ATP-binding protein/branched-chain amino acid transport system permease protein